MEKNLTPSQEALNMLKESLKDFYILQEDLLWGKKGEVVKYLGELGKSSTKWMHSNGCIEPFVACTLAYCIDRKSVKPLFDHIKEGGVILMTELSALMK